MIDRTHQLRVFRDDEFPTADIVAHLEDGLDRGAAAVVFAAAPQLDAISRELGRRRDTAALVSEDRLQLHDGTAIAVRLAAHDGDERVMDELVGLPLSRVLARHGRARVYDDIVDVLARRGHHELAVAVESWWQRQIGSAAVELLCGYALSSFADARHVHWFRRVCAAHGEVQPAEPRPVNQNGRVVAELEQTLVALETESRRRDDTREHLARLQRLTSALSEAATAHAIAEAVVQELQKVFNADVALYVVADRGDRLKLLAASRADGEQAVDGLTTPRGVAIGGVPLAVGGRRLGALRLVYRDGGQPDELDRELLDDYAGQVALALERARSHEEAQTARRRLQVLTDVASRIARARLDLHEVLDTIVREVRNAGLADTCSVDLDIAAGSLLPIDDHRAVVPLRSSGEVIGRLVAARGRGFSAEDRELLQELADRAALAVENARLFERAQEERERAEQERRRAEAANRAKDEFLAVLGHELRNPLSPILTAVQLMRLRAGDLLGKERTIIERQVSHMVRLVDDLLDVSRITRGKVELRRAPVEVAQIVANAIELASPLLEERSHKLVTHVASTGLAVEGDAARLAQVVANLLTNAAKYTPPGGTVEVGADAGDGRVKLSVRDSGVGIEPALLPRIFDLFVQGRQAIDRAPGGLGLGLAIARNLAEMHEGSLTAASEGAGKGSTFTLELPLLGGRAATRRLTLPPPSGERAVLGRRVLVVDDNADAAHMLAEALETVGHTVRVAHDGPGALALAASFRPELALLDIGLPVMDGYELARRLRAGLGAAAPRMVAITGYGQDSDRRQSLAAGFAEHLVKPVDLSILERTLKALNA